jgi:hypothetical protein
MLLSFLFGRIFTVPKFSLYFFIKSKDKINSDGLIMGIDHYDGIYQIA